MKGTSGTSAVETFVNTAGDAPDEVADSLAGTFGVDDDRYRDEGDKGPVKNDHREDDADETEDEFVHSVEAPIKVSHTLVAVEHGVFPSGRVQQER